MIPVQALKPPVCPVAPAPACPPPVTPDPDLLFTGDLWQLPVEVRDNATGASFNMTGCAPVAAVYLPDGSAVALTTSNGGIAGFQATQGVFSVIVAASITASIPALQAAGGRHPIAIQVGYHDSAGVMHTVDTYLPCVVQPGFGPAPSGTRRPLRLAVYRQGPAGPPGNSTTYTFVFGAQVLWAIPHGLGRFPSVTMIDTAGDIILGDVDYLDANTIAVSFSAPVSGVAYLN